MDEFLCEGCIAAMPWAKFALACGFAAGFSLFGLLRARQSLFRARLIEDMPTSRIRSASQGYAELVGLGSDRGEPTVSPLTAQTCLWWRYTIERYESSGKSSSWRTIKKGSSTRAFYMDDGTGLCRIEPEGAEISALHRNIWYGTESFPVPGSAASKAGLLGSLTKISFGQRYRYTEYLIRDGDPIYVLGHFVSDSTGQRLLTVDQVAGQLISEWKQDFDKLLVQFDTDGNGRLDEQEWQKVHASAREQARRQQQQDSGGVEDHSIVKPLDNSLTYLIGSHAQEHLASRFRLQSAGFALLFLVAGSLTTWLLASRFF